MSARWFNAAAVEWVLYEAPADLPWGLVLTLVAVASFAGADGRAAYPSADVVAMLTRRSVRQVRRDMDALQEKKLLLPGDRRTVANLRADRRPNVWDLPRDAREYIGRHRKRGDTVSPRTGGHGVIPQVPRGDKTALNGVTNATERGDTVSPEEFLKNSGKGAPPARAAGAGDGTPQTRTPTPPPAEEREPVDVAAEIARTKARLAELNGRWR